MNGNNSNNERKRVTRKKQFSISAAIDVLPDHKFNAVKNIYFN